MNDQSLKPRKVPPARVFLWYRLAFELLGRRPLFWMAFGTVAVVVLIAVRLSPALSALLALVTLMTCVTVAATVDQAKPGSPLELAGVVRKTLPLASYLSALFVLCLVVIIALIALIIDAHEVWVALLYFPLPLTTLSEGLQAANFQLSLPSLIGMYLALVLNLIVGDWFTFALMVFFELPFRRARRSATEAFWLNRAAILIAFGVTLAGSLAVLALVPLLTVPVYCLIGAALYVAFRDVFLGRGKNEPVASFVGARLAAVK